MSGDPQASQVDPDIALNLVKYSLRVESVVNLNELCVHGPQFRSALWCCRVCVSEVGGLSMVAAGELRSPVSCSSEPDDSTEPYTTERLSRLPGGYKSLTQPFTALNIDFNNVQVQ